MKIQTSLLPVFVPVAVVVIGVAVLIAGHIAPPHHEYNMTDMIADIKQCTDAGLHYQSNRGYGMPRVPADGITSIDCVLNDGGTMRADAHNK